MAYQTIISTHELNEHLDDARWVIFDCRFSLLDTAAGERQYREGHIPGARYANLDNDLSGPITAASGRHPLPDPQELEYKLQQWGVNANSQIVAYDDADGAIAARLWFLLRWLGHRDVAVLDGGITQWQTQGCELSTVIPVPHRGDFQSQCDDSCWVSTDELVRRLQLGDVMLFDARSEERYNGASEPLDSKAGHVPGAINRPYQESLDTAGRFRSQAELAQEWATQLQRTAGSGAAIHMCGSGVTACHNILSMEMSGYQGSRLYVGSWSEWIRSDQRPVATGEAG